MFNNKNQKFKISKSKLNCYSEIDENKNGLFAPNYYTMHDPTYCDNFWEVTTVLACYYNEIPLTLSMEFAKILDIVFQSQSQNKYKFRVIIRDTAYLWCTMHTCIPNVLIFRKYHLIWQIFLSIVAYSLGENKLKIFTLRAFAGILRAYLYL